MKGNILLLRYFLILVIVYSLISIYSRLVLITSKTPVEFDSINSKSKPIKMKYILQWTTPSNVPFIYMGKQQHVFVNKKCKYANCFVTSNRSYLKDYTMFDVIAFAGPELSFYLSSLLDMPIRRSMRQKYVFASIESSQYYPVCTNECDSYFNWTWTFRLDSDVQWGYFIIRDSNHNIIGPKINMNWKKLQDMSDVSEDFKIKLRNKKIAAAVFVSNCVSVSQRENIIIDLQRTLNKYGHNLDVYGDCGNLKCSRANEAKCDKLIADIYYFYLSFENALSEDYVTEKLLRALNNDAIPIVYGGANYTRFMPDGIYLNVRELGVEKLAEKMVELINKPELYANYFKWKNHYSYHRMSESPETDEYCKFCEILNDEEKVNKYTIYKDFKNWWNPDEFCME